MDDAFVRSTRDVLTHFNVSEESGLSDSAVLSSREKHGSNCENAICIMLRHVDS